MIEKITQDRISLTLPTVFGDELTFLEFCGKMRSKLNECIGVVNGNTSNIEDVTSKTSENTANIQQNATAISRNESDIIKLNGVVNSISAQTDENTVNINTVSGKVDKNTTDIQQNTTGIQQNTSAISANEASIAALNTAFNALRTDFLNKKVESLFAPVILNVESHEPGADINASVYVRIGRIDWQGLGCLYAKINLSFSGATAAKTLKINSVQFGDQKAADIASVSTSFTAKTNVFGIPISIVGTETLPVGTSDIAVTGINLLGMSIVAESLASSFSLDSIPTGIDIPCESLAFTSPAGGESDPKIVYTLKISEGYIDIYLTSGGQPLTTTQAILNVDFTDTISDSIIYDQFLCAGGVYDENTLSSVSENGQALGAAIINHTGYTNNGHVYNARMIIRDADNAPTDEKLLLKPAGIATKKIPLGEFAHVSLTFDMFN